MRRSPLPSPEGWGEGVGDFARFSNHNVLNRYHFSPLPQWGRGQGEVIFSAKKDMSKFMNSWTTFNEHHYFAKTKPDTVGI
jgi:hypothetical protein